MLLQRLLDPTFPVSEGRQDGIEEEISLPSQSVYHKFLIYLHSYHWLSLEVCLSPFVLL